MMTDTFDIIDKFLTDIRFKLRCQFIHRTCKHKVLPYHQSQFITEIKEPILRIIAASPDTNCIKVSSLALEKQFSGTFSGCSLQQIIFRNIVSTHSKYLITIYFMGKALSPFIFFDMHSQSAETNFSAPGVYDLISCYQIHLNFIQWLFSQSVWPPKLWMINLYFIRAVLPCILGSVR